MYYSNDPFYDQTNVGFTNISHHSVHLSPEELAAIDHGLMSVYGRDKENINFNTPFNTKIDNINNGKPMSYNTNYFNTPTPSAPNSEAVGNKGGIFNTNSLFNQNQNQNYHSNSNNFYNAASNNLYNPNTNYQQKTANPFSDQQQNQNTHNNYFPQTPHTPFQQTQSKSQNQQNQSPPATVIDENLVKSYEKRIENLLKHEREKYEMMEIDYRNQLKELKKNDFGYSEKLKLEQIIQDLRRQIDELERQLLKEKQQQNLNSNYSNDTNNNNNKLEALKFHYDRKIANLIGQFEQEKASALEIFKTRAKAEINLLIPRLKNQIQASLEKTHTESVNRIKGQASLYIQKMKQDFQMERQVLAEHLRRKHFEEIKQIQNQLQTKYEIKFLEEKKKMQERERDRFTNSNSNSNNANTNTYSNNTNYNTRNNKHNYNTIDPLTSSQYPSFFGDEPSFLL